MKEKKEPPPRQSIHQEHSPDAIAINVGGDMNVLAGATNRHLSTALRGQLEEILQSGGHRIRVGSFQDRESKVLAAEFLQVARASGCETEGPDTYLGGHWLGVAVGHRPDEPTAALVAAQIVQALQAAGLRSGVVERKETEEGTVELKIGYTG